LREGRHRAVCADRRPRHRAVFQAAATFSPRRAIRSKSSNSRSFTGAPLLDQTILSAYIRFTDETAAELQQQLQSAKNLRKRGFVVYLSVGPAAPSIQRPPFPRIFQIR